MGTKLFTIGSFEEELAKSMEDKLISNQAKNKESYNQITKAVDLVNAAATIFDDTGFTVEAEVLTRLLERLATRHITKAAQALEPEDAKFFEALAPHHKDRLSKMDKKQLIDEIHRMRIDSMIGEELGKGPADLPEVIEFESLLGRGKQLPTSSRWDDIIEFQSLPKKKV